MSGGGILTRGPRRQNGSGRAEADAGKQVGTRKRQKGVQAVPREQTRRRHRKTAGGLHKGNEKHKEQHKSSRPCSRVLVFGAFAAADAARRGFGRVYPASCIMFAVWTRLRSRASWTPMVTTRLRSRGVSWLRSCLARKKIKKARLVCPGPPVSRHLSSPKFPIQFPETYLVQ